eukprot:evm.model.NODE_25939_length_3308_cov_20.610641.2
MELFEVAWAHYVTSAKHHDGYTWYPSTHSANWNTHIELGQDLLAELQAAFRVGALSLRFNPYYSIYEWLHSLYYQDKDNNWTSQAFVTQKTGT